MKSVPPRGSGWVKPLPIFNCRLPIARLATRQLEIGNRQLAILRATRYREVVLTSFERLEPFIKHDGDFDHVVVRLLFDCVSKDREPALLSDTTTDALPESYLEGML